MVRPNLPMHRFSIEHRKTSRTAWSPLQTQSVRQAAERLSGASISGVSISGEWGHLRLRIPSPLKLTYKVGILNKLLARLACSLFASCGNFVFALKPWAFYGEKIP